MDRSGSFRRLVNVKVYDALVTPDGKELVESGDY